MASVAESNRSWARQLKELLGLSTPPMAIVFSRMPPAGLARYAAEVPAPTPDGRTGPVAASCVYWMKGTERAFYTLAEDHGNCSVGGLTHGFKSLAEAAKGADVQALVASEWVAAEAFPGLPVVKGDPACVSYSPLADTAITPDVVFLRIQGKQAMMLHDAWPGLRFEGKPQCHIIAIAKEQGRVAVSVGCMLSRVRTGMANADVTCAVPARVLPDLLGKLAAAVAADTKVAAYAAADAQRFAK
jgi:uncharacterized protein (DUF169 family)